jgi:hypothetical protein
MAVLERICTSHAEHVLQSMTCRMIPDGRMLCLTSKDVGVPGEDFMEEDVHLKQIERLRKLLDILLSGRKGTAPMSIVVKRMHEAIELLGSFGVKFSQP